MNTLKAGQILALACLILRLSAIGVSASSISYAKMWIRGVPVHVVIADLNDPNVKVSPAIAHHGIGTSEGFGSMISRLKPSAAITGTYFCPRTLQPVGYIIVNGQRVHSGDVGTMVCFTAANTVEFRQRSDADKINWTDYPYAISTGPRLVTYGVPGVFPHDEGFKDRSLYRPARRSALGVTKANKLLLVTVERPIHLGKLACIMHDLGAYQAVNLDGGSSTALHYKGRSLSHPSRRMTNLIVVYESPSQFDTIKSELAPTHIVAGAPTKF